MTRWTSPMTRRTSPMTPSVVISKVWGLYIWDDKLMITEMKMSRMKMKRVSQYSGGLREAIQVKKFQVKDPFNAMNCNCLVFPPLTSLVFQQWSEEVENNYLSMVGSSSNSSVIVFFVLEVVISHSAALCVQMSVVCHQLTKSQQPDHLGGWYCCQNDCLITYSEEEKSDTLVIS